MSKKKLVIGGTPAEAAPLNERTVGVFIAENSEKWDRAIHGSIGAEGKLMGGVGDDATPEAKLAEYDRLGGLVTKGGRKVKTGSFYDFGAQEVRKEPEVVLVFRDLEGDEVEVPDGEEIPVEVKAAEIAGKKKAGAVEKAAKSPKKVKPSIEDVDEQ